MLGLFRKRRGSTPPTTAPSTPPGICIYAVGDIHGRYDLLLALQDKILADAAERQERHKIAIYLGDYIDRGPDSRKVVAHLHANPLPDFTSIHLMGNHEQSMLGFIRAPDHHANWLQFGGLATLTSYGVGSSALGLETELRQMARELEMQIPEPERVFLERLEAYRVFGDYLFVHAGIRPERPLESQEMADLFWIREDFLRYTKPHSHVVVHGHHVTEEPVVKDNRIGIDTGAFATGCLTCLMLDGEERRFIDTREPETID
ncbi:metallophosphoesterase family protein [Thiorhodococcus fuscus]|uniref:Metallophosphoesterase family protein n=1 Tax=Thiorhodococcus fuscus TaxID=527200 RepID=A0ABW4Y3J4_9GAMM